MQVTTQKEFHHVAEFAAATDLSVATVRRRIKDGSIPAVRLGGRGAYLIPRSFLDYLSNGNGPGRTRIAARPQTVEIPGDVRAAGTPTE